MKENQRILLSKRLMQEGLLRLLESKPIEKISVKELCNESGVNRSTFYRHYQTTLDVFLDLQINISKDIFMHTEKADLSPKEYLECVCTYLYENSDLIKIIIKNNSEELLIPVLNGVLKKLIKDKNKTKEIEDVDEEDLKLISAFLAGGGYNLIREWLIGDIKKTPKEVADVILLFINYEYKIK